MPNRQLGRSMRIRLRLIKNISHMRMRLLKLKQHRHQSAGYVRRVHHKKTYHVQPAKRQTLKRIINLTQRTYVGKSHNLCRTQSSNPVNMSDKKISDKTPVISQKLLTVEIPLNDTLLTNSNVPPPIKRQSTASLTQRTDVKPIYLGTDIHAYTQQVNQLNISTQLDPILDSEFQFILQDMQQVYGPKEAFSNLKNVYSRGMISDPEVPHINFALILKQLWSKLRELNEDSAYRHFGETLDQIGMTCIQGVTHRLLIDHNAFV